MTDQDLYQERYLAHQKRKREVLEGLLKQRHSDRVFDSRPLADEDSLLIMRALHTAPSSCARRGVLAVPYSDRDSKALLGGLLVGGVGWVHRAPTVFILTGDPEAYKAPGEASYMPYLDAGVMVGQALLAATSSGLAACYINPNIREVHRPLFDNQYGAGIFCGALAVGYPAPPDENRWIAPTEAIATPGLHHPPEGAALPQVSTPCGCDPEGKRLFCLPGCERLDRVGI